MILVSHQHDAFRYQLLAELRLMGDEFIMVCIIALEILAVTGGIRRGDDLCRRMTEGTGDDGGVLHGKIVCHQSHDQQKGKKRVPQPAECFIAHAFLCFHERNPF